MSPTRCRREWSEGDEIVVTSLDHDANIRPWVLAARRAGATVRWAEFDTDTGELPAERFDEVIGDRTRLVAVTAASNAIGSRPDVRAIADRAHAVGALVYVDGVHATPHVPTDMRAPGRGPLRLLHLQAVRAPRRGGRGRPGAPGAHVAGEARAGVRRRA